MPEGRTLAHWRDIQFILVICRPGDGPAQGRVVQSIQLAAASRADASSRTGEPWRDQSKGYYSTPRHDGVQIGYLSEGLYELYVTARVVDDVVSLPLGRMLRVHGNWGVGHKPLIGVVGSCVSRDNFSSRVMPEWREDFGLHGAQYQSFLISLMAPASPISANSLSDLGSHAMDTVLRDFSKEYLRELHAAPPDMLVVDLYADARFGVIRLGDSWVTDNEWTLGTSAFAEELVGNEHVSLSERRDLYRELFAGACRAFEVFRREHLPATRVVLNRARATYYHRGLGAGGSFGVRQQRKLNALWDELEEIFLNTVSAETITPLLPTILSDSRHVWTTGPVHYERKYYEEYRRQLLALAEYRCVLGLSDAEAATDQTGSDPEGAHAVGER